MMISSRLLRFGILSGVVVTLACGHAAAPAAGSGRLTAAVDLQSLYQKISSTTPAAVAARQAFHRTSIDDVYAGLLASASDAVVNFGGVDVANTRTKLGELSAAIHQLTLSYGTIGALKQAAGIDPNQAPTFAQFQNAVSLALHPIAKAPSSPSLSLYVISRHNALILNSDGSQCDPETDRFCRSVLLWTINPATAAHGETETLTKQYNTRVLGGETNAGLAQTDAELQADLSGAGIVAVVSGGQEGASSTYTACPKTGGSAQYVTEGNNEDVHCAPIQQEATQ